MAVLQLTQRLELHLRLSPLLVHVENIRSFCTLHSQLVLDAVHDAAVDVVQATTLLLRDDEGARVTLAERFRAGSIVSPFAVHCC